MFELELLRPESAKPYQKFTYQSYRNIIVDETIPAEKRPLLIGAHVNQQPIGLIVVAREAEQTGTKLASLFVQESFRKQGVGTALMKYVLEVVRARGVTNVKAEYYALPHIQAFERVLEKSGWNRPAVYSHYYRFELKNLESARWMRRIRVPAGYRVVVWNDMPKEQLGKMAELQEEGYLSYYDPLWNEDKIAGTCSCVLLEGDTIVGWSIIEQHMPDTLLYRTLYIREAYRNLGLGLVLAAQTSKIGFESTVPYCVIQIALQNEQMQKVARSFIDPLRPVVTEYRGCEWEEGRER